MNRPLKRENELKQIVADYVTKNIPIPADLSELELNVIEYYMHILYEGIMNKHHSN